ncbi:hypothetical protein NERG_01136 [Nematocida ausubeli]|uniref:Uncharacterized protein n=1 Tax=Nematocida ausubeli (strain ATCC PRA-371 / ERTm2) TaxID=1913371 RepID=H8ZCY9_NEMA1|nr:hypothetical protein NERG_01136 [Nematocida ausubeli]
MRTRIRNGTCRYVYVNNRKEKTSTMPCTRRASIGSVTKMALIAALLAMQSVFGFIEIEDASEVQKAVVCKIEGVDYVPRPDGPLSPIMLYLGKKSNDICCYRALSSNINSHIIVSDKENEDKHKRDTAKDTVYAESASGGKLEESTASHFSAMTNMIPFRSKTSEITLQEDDKDLFTLFLNSDLVKSYAHRIVIALLLKVEGVNVPLFLEKDKDTTTKLVWRWRDQKKEFFSINILDAAKEILKRRGQGEEESSVYKKNIVKTIQYFISVDENKIAKKNPVERENLHDKTKYWKDEYMNSRNWLIQVYIYCYIRTKEDAIKFNKEVYAVLSECMQQNQKSFSIVESQEQKFFKKCFMPKNTESKALSYWEKLKSLNDIDINPEPVQLLPFTNSRHLPTRKMVEISIQGNLHLKTEVFASDIESALLGLFCCFVYDSKENKYNLDHMPLLMKEIKDLFPMPFNSNKSFSDKECKLAIDSECMHPGNKIPKKICEEWAKIIRIIVENEDTISCKTNIDGTRAIKSDICNFFIIFLKLINSYDCSNKKVIEDIRKDIMGIGKEKDLKKQKILYSNFKDKIQSYISELFSFFSRNHTASKDIYEWYEKTPSNMKKEKLFVNFIPTIIQENQAEYYLIGTLEIYYAYERQAQPIILQLTTLKKAFLALDEPIIKLDKSIKKEIDNLKLTIGEIEHDTYPEYIISIYIQSIWVHSSDYIIIDSHINRDNEHISIKPAAFQPWYHNSICIDELLNGMEKQISSHTQTKKYNIFNARVGYNLIGNMQLHTRRLLLFLIVYIGLKHTPSDIALINSFYTIANNNIKKRMAAVGLDYMEKVLENLLIINADLDIANVIAAYAQIYGDCDPECLCVLFKRLLSKGIDTDKILRYVNKYSTIVEKEPSLKKSL